MKFTIIFIYFISFFLISSCSVHKAAKYLKEGQTSEKNYKVTFPFEIKNGFIIVNVEIENEDYNFILDSGTPTLISKKLVKKLNLKAIDSVNASDVFGKEQSNKYTRIQNIKIGTIDFLQTVALINDFNSKPIWSSLEIDGFFGSNLMQHTIWDIDFINNQITITNNELKLNLPEKIIENKLFIGYDRTPAIGCKINGEKIWNFTVDFGFNGDVVIPFSEFEKQKENGQISDFTESKSNGVIGIYGKQDKTRVSYTGKINEIEFGNSILTNVKAYSEQYLSHRFGLDFFRNYRVILNWNSKKIKLIENTSS